MENNFLKSYQEYSSQVTDSPIKFHQFMALSLAGTSIGRKRYFQFGHQQIFPNFYMIILAPSSLYRKSTSLSISQGMLKAVNPLKVYPSDFSQEKIMETLKENPCGAFYYFEFKSLMELMSRDYMASAKSFFTELYDCNDMGVARKTMSYDIKEPCVSIVSATTVDWFTQSIRKGDIEGGFLSRFIYVFSKHKIRDDSIPPEPDTKKWGECIRQLEILENLIPTKMTLSKEARERYDKFYKYFGQKYEKMDHSYRNLFNRLTIYCIKIAIVIETCTTGNIEISLETIEKAIQTVNWLIETTSDLCGSNLSFSKYESQENKIVNFLENKKVVSRVDLLRHSRLPARDFDNVLQTLSEKEIITIEHEPIEGSHKKSTVIKYNGNIN